MPVKPLDKENNTLRQSGTGAGPTLGR